MPFLSTLISSSELTKPSIWFELRGYNFEVLELVSLAFSGLTTSKNALEFTENLFMFTWRTLQNQATIKL